MQHTNKQLTTDLFSAITKKSWILLKITKPEQIALRPEKSFICSPISETSQKELLDVLLVSYTVFKKQISETLPRLRFTFRAFSGTPCKPIALSMNAQSELCPLLSTLPITATHIQTHLA